MTKDSGGGGSSKSPRGRAQAQSKKSTDASKAAMDKRYGAKKAAPKKK